MDKDITANLPTRSFKLYGEYDVVVCGGGPSGVIAATAAARLGAHTLLIERNGFLGGMATAAEVTQILGIETIGGERVVEGIPAELLNRIETARNYPGSIAFNPDSFKHEADWLVADSKADILFDCLMTDVVTEYDLIRMITIETPSERLAVRAKMIIDATGDSHIVTWAGAPSVQYEKMMPVTLGFTVANVGMSMQEFWLEMEKVQPGMVEAARRGELPPFGGPWITNIRPGVFGFNMTRRQGNTLDPVELSRLERQLRDDVHRIVDYFRRNVRGFENCYLQRIAPQVGVRETRATVGRYMLTEQDVLTGREFEDAVALGCWLIDIHPQAGEEGDIGYHPMETVNPYHIPYRAMLPQGIRNLIVTGRCLSADRAAQSSTRVMGTCMALGQAAGTVAALCLEREELPEELHVPSLLDVLRENGAKLTI